MQYNEAVAYINKIPKFASKNTLDNTAYFLANLGNPQERYKIIHVAGTNGKGSTCSYLNSMICSMGYTVGMFTSPHLVSMNERIRINNKDITEKEFLAIFTMVKNKAIELETEGIPHPSFFEFIMIMAMVAFEREGVEYVILETGLGGRFDCTNVIKAPVATIITSVGMDHEQYLGNSVEEIAYQKAGIIKRETPLIYDDSDTSVSKVIEKVAKLYDNICRKISDYAYEITDKTDKYIAFSIIDRYDNNMKWQIPNKGRYQVKNAILAIMCMEELFGGQALAQRKEGIKNSYWPGRMEEILPNVVIDGAHNIPAVKVLVQEVDDIDTLVFASVEDKNYEAIIKKILENMQIAKVIVTTLDNRRAVNGKLLANIFHKYGQEEVMVMDNVREISEYLKTKELEEKILCMGSLYLVGELKNYINNSKEKKC